MSLGKAITLYLIDGVPSGRIACELFNWTGKAYKIPRTLLKESADRDELFKAGVYFLIGRDENDPEDHIVYVGEAEEVYRRLQQHQNKDFWTEAIVFISKDENLNKAHIKFLEHEAFEQIKKAKRASLENGNTPTRSSISEMEEAVMTEFFENLKLLMSSLGYKIFEPIAQSVTGRKAPIYSLSGPRGANAKALVTTEGVVVKKGSNAAVEVVPSTPDSITKLRQRLLEADVLAEVKDSLVFQEDYLFSSPSTAAAVVLGRNANGRIEWKDRKGKTLKANEEGE